MRQELERVRAELRATKRRQKAAAGMVTTKREHRNIMRTATQQAERGVRTLEQSESSWNAMLGQTAARTAREEDGALSVSTTVRRRSRKPASASFSLFGSSGSSEAVLFTSRAQLKTFSL